MNESTEIQVKHTMDVLAPIGLDLRKRGYDANLWVETRGEKQFTVELRVNVPGLGVPIEATP